MLISTLKHEDQAWGLRFSPDGHFLTAMVRTKKKVVRWDVKTREQQSVVDLSREGYIKREAYSYDGRLSIMTWVVSKPPPDHDEEWVRIWNLETGKETASYHGRDLSSSAISPNGKFVAVVKRDDPVNDRGEVVLLDVATGKKLTTLPDPAASAYAGGFYGVSFSPDSKMLVTEGWDHEKMQGEVRLWDIETRKVRATLTGSVGLMQVSFSPDGKIIATRSWDDLRPTREQKGELKLWDAATGKAKVELKGHRAQIMRAVFSPDGKVLATGSGTLNLAPVLDPAGIIPSPPDVTELKLWDVATGKELANLGGHKNPVYAIEFSPDGRLLASASGFATKPGELRLWDVRTGKPLPAPDGLADGLTSLAFSPDSKVLAVSDGKGTVKLWDVSGAGKAPKQ